MTGIELDTHHHADMTTPTTTTPNLNWIANYIWGIADDVLRDVYVRGKYRDGYDPRILNTSPLWS